MDWNTRTTTKMNDFILRLIKITPNKSVAASMLSPTSVEWQRTLIRNGFFIHASNRNNWIQSPSLSKLTGDELEARSKSLNEWPMDNDINTIYYGPWRHNETGESIGIRYNCATKCLEKSPDHVRWYLLGSNNPFVLGYEPIPNIYRAFAIGYHYGAVFTTANQWEYGVNG